MRVLLGIVAGSLIVLGACAEKSPRLEQSGSHVTLPNVSSDGTTPAPANPTVAASIGNQRCPSGEALTAGSVKDGVYLATFDGKPPGPHSACGLTDWDIQVHSRDTGTLYDLESIEAQHGPDCSPPPATHHSSGYDTAVFQCRDHIMTAINAGGYGVIYLSPNQALDLSKGEAVVRFDVSTLALSDRDWWDVWITPFDDYLALPLDSWLPDLQGEPRNGLHVRTGDADGAVCAELWIDGKEQLGGQFESGCDWSTGIRDLLTPSSTVRTPFEIRIGSSHIKVCMVTPAFCWMDRSIPALSWETAVVQLGHHSYTPGKGRDGAGIPNTWHWDNVSLSPVREFTIIKADRRYVDEEDSVIRFATTAPAGAYARFSAVGKVEIDDGSGWRSVEPSVPTQHNEHMNSYFVPVPAGTSALAVRFRNDDWYSGPFIAKDFALWVPPD